MIFNIKSLKYDSYYDSIRDTSWMFPSLIKLTEISNRNSKISTTSVDCNSTEYHIKYTSMIFRKNRLKNIRHKIFIELNISTFSKNYLENHLNRRIYHLNETSYPRPPFFAKKIKTNLYSY